MSGKSGKSGKSTGKNPGAPPLSVTGVQVKSSVVTKDSAIKEMKSKIVKLRQRINANMNVLKDKKTTEDDKHNRQLKMRSLIDELKTELSALRSDPDSKSLIDAMEVEVKGLEDSIAFPYRPQPSVFPQEQRAIAAAAEVVANWERVTPGVSLNDLPEPARILLEACTTESWSPFQIVSREMFGTSRETLMPHHINVAAALFQAMVPQYCGVNIPTQEQVEQNVNNVGVLLRHIAIVAFNKCKEGYNPIFVFAEAAFRNPLQFLKDATGVGFALGALTEMVGPTAVSAAGQLPGAALTAVKYVAGNPLASFTTYKVAEPYIKGLIQQVLGERFGVNFGNGQAVDPNIQILFDRLSEHYLREGVTDIIGFPPADRDSILNRLSQILYQIGYRSVASLQSTGGIVSDALHFPGELCKSVMSAGSAINRWWCDKGTQLVERYKFIPQGTEEGLFEALLHVLTESGLLEDPDINKFVVAYLRHNQPTTVFIESVEYHMAQHTMIHGPLLSAGDMSESLDATKDPDSQPGEMEELGTFGGSDLPADAGHISAEQNLLSSNGSQLANFRTDQQRGILQYHELQSAARTAEEAATRRQGASAQGGNVNSPFTGVLSGARANISSSFASGPAQGGLPGGRSRSRKRSVSKRTRRKGIAKKQNSKKNKRQTRRKVRRASSRKSRK